MSQVQTEIQELKRRYRILENDKKAYEDESTNMLKRQANLINKLKEENRTYCQRMLDGNKKKKEMDVARKTMAVHQVEINALKEKVDVELVK